MSTGKFFLLDASGATQHQLQLPSNCSSAFSLSPDQRSLAVGYYIAHHALQIYDLASGSLVDELWRAFPSDVEYEPTGRYIILRPFGKHEPYAYDLRKRGLQRIAKNGGSPVNSAWREDGAWLTLKMRTRQGYLVQFHPLSVSEVDLPVPKRVWVFKNHPSGKTFTVMDESCTITNVSFDGMEKIWQTRHDADWLCYSGDGRFIALTQSDTPGGPVKRLVILDSSTGELVRVIEHNKRASDPLVGAKVLSLDGRFVDLETGEISPGVRHLANELLP